MTRADRRGGDRRGLAGLPGGLVPMNVSLSGDLHARLVAYEERTGRRINLSALLRGALAEELDAREGGFGASATPSTMSRLAGAAVTQSAPRRDA